MENAPGNLLIVDDDSANRSLLRRFLEPKGYHITDAADGQAALDWARKRPFDLVLLDVLMPGLGGLEVLEALRRAHSVTDLPVIMATSRDQPADVVKALQLGANDYVTKPFDFPVLLARVQTQLALRRSNAELAEANRRMRRDLAAAARVQKSLLPGSLPRVAGADFAWRFEPCAELAGDLLNVAVLDDSHVALYVLDVVGHGVAAALLAVMVNRALLRRIAPGGKPASPGEVVAHLNAEFPWDDRTQQFFTLLYGVLDLAGGEFHYVSAGHPGPLYLTGGGEGRALKASGPPIPLGDGQYEESALPLRPGDRLYLYSDGLTEAMNGPGEQFGEGRLGDELLAARGADLRGGLDRLMLSVQTWCAPRAAHDDISVLAVELTQR